MRDIYSVSIEERCVMLAKHLVQNQSTVRAVAADFGISKSTVHKDISHTLQRIDVNLYEEAKAVLEKNKQERHIRGGEATKNKYIKYIKGKNEKIKKIQK